MALLTSFEKYIQTQHLFTKKDRLLIAVSGGVDSVVLCELCYLAGYDFAIAHVNFQLRAEESDADQLMVTGLASKYNVPFFLKKTDTMQYANQKKVSIQVAARELRYQWFQDLLKQDPTLKYIITAHHADDNTETILMNFFKGTGINGLKGIVAQQQQLVRPLLFATKAELLEFASLHQLLFREDASNAEDKYTRNYFRNQLIPDLQKVFPQVVQNLQHNAQRFLDIHHIYQEAVAGKKKKMFIQEGATYKIPVLKLLNEKAHHSILYEIIKDFGFTAAQTIEVEKLLHAPTGKYIQSTTHRVLRDRKWLLLTALHSDKAGHYVLDAEPSKTSFEGGELSLSFLTAPVSLTVEPNIALLDASLIQFPLLLRKWKTGDYFYPLGMTKKKKLSRFFIDQKLSMAKKEQIWVLESNQKIVWVLGIRIDNRFKVTPQSEGIVKLHLSGYDQ